MSDVFTTFELGTVIVPVQSAYELSQTYEPLGGFTTIRMLNGAALKQQNWERIATTIQGSGVIPSGLEGLDYSVSQLMKCAAPRAVTSIATVIVIPAERRTDPGFEPTGFAFVDPEGKGRGLWKETPIISIVVDTVTLTVVAGASNYQVRYFPEFEVFSEKPSQTIDVHPSDQNWTLEAEQI